MKLETEQRAYSSRQLCKVLATSRKIQLSWQRIKEDELAGQMFEDEYELSMAVISAIEARQARNGLAVKRYHFTRERI